MNKPHVYEICLEGHVPARWSDWFANLTLRNEPNGLTTLRGQLADQAALFGVLSQIHALNLALISVNRVSSRHDSSPE